MNMATDALTGHLQTISRNVDLVSLINALDLPHPDLDANQVAQLVNLPQEMLDALVVDKHILPPEVSSHTNEKGQQHMVLEAFDGPVIAVHHADLGRWFVLNAAGRERFFAEGWDFAEGATPEFILSVHRTADEARRALHALPAGLETPEQRIRDTAAVHAQSGVLHLLAALGMMNYLARCELDSATADIIEAGYPELPAE